MAIHNLIIAVVFMLLATASAKKIVVLSDLHVVGAYHNQSWEVHATELLNTIALDRNVGTIILLGDTFCIGESYADPPKSIDTNIAESSFAEYFREFIIIEATAGVTVYHVMGNGDEATDQAWWDDWVGPNMVIGAGLHLELTLSDGSYVVFEHGHSNEAVGFGPYGLGTTLTRIQLADKHVTSMMEIYSRCDSHCQSRITSQWFRWAALEVLANRDRDFIRNSIAYVFWVMRCVAEDQIHPHWLDCRIDPSEMEDTYFWIENNTQPYRVTFAELVPMVASVLPAPYIPTLYAQSRFLIPHWIVLVQNSTLEDLHNPDKCPYDSMWTLASQWNIVATLRAFARKRASEATALGRNVAAVLFGHTHQPEVVPLTTNTGVPFTYINVGSWIHEPRGLVSIDEDTKVATTYTMRWDTGFVQTGAVQL